METTTHSHRPELFRLAMPEPPPECERCVRPAVVIMCGHLLCGECFLQVSIRIEEDHQ